MNRKNLTAAVLAGLAGVAGIAGTAQAVNVNPDGTGQVLLYPYYTTNAGNVTLLSVVNTSEDAKAVKVRFMEAENSQEVLDFNLYMSAYDVWTAAINPMPADAMYDDCDPFLGVGEEIYCEGPLLTIAADETTCTVPYLMGAQPFLPFQYAGDMGSQDQSRMNEGHFEMIEMGTLIADEWAAIAATHGVNGESSEWQPASCEALNLAWTDLNDQDPDKGEGRWLVDPTDGLTNPSGGLFGGAAVIDVQEGAMHTYDATALNGWNMSGTEYDPTGLGGDSIHAVPGTTKPDLNSGDQVNGLVFSAEGAALDSGMLTAPIDAVSYVLQHDTLMNEYTTEMGVNAETEWVITFPTKRWYVNGVDAPARPFTTAWAPVLADSLATACESVELNVLWDREERIEPEKTCEEIGNCPGVTPPVVSPPRPGVPPDPDNPVVPFELCYETNVVRFGAATETDDGASIDVLPEETEIFGTPKGAYRNIDNEALAFQYGWARIELDLYTEQTCVAGTCTDMDMTREPIGTDPASQLNGLPIVGFAAQRFTNGFLGEEADVLSAYGGLFKHKTSRKVGSDVVAPAP